MELSRDGETAYDASISLTLGFLEVFSSPGEKFIFGPLTLTVGNVKQEKLLFSSLTNIASVNQSADDRRADPLVILKLGKYF